MRHHLYSLLVIITLFTVALTLAPAPVMAESGTLTDCIMGCIPNDEACINCCKETFAATEPMNCCGDYGSCTERCESLEGTRAVMCFRNCQARLKVCHDKYSTEVKEFSCPDWMQAKDCPFDCQTWSPVSRKCVGVPQSCD